MKKVVLKLDLHDDKEKQKAFKAVSGVYGIDKVGVDMELQRMTIVGTVDPVAAVGKLRKLFPTTQILYVGPANKMPAKKEVNKKQQEEKPVYPAPHWWYVGHGAGAEADPNTGVICWPNTRRGNKTTY